MVDLSDLKVGDFVVISTDVECEVVMINELGNLILKSPKGRLDAFHKGNNGYGVSIKSKVDMNAWWVKLPPAKYFEMLNIEQISRANNSFRWYAHLPSGDALKLNLDIEVTKAAIINIADLKKWQEGK